MARALDTEFPHNRARVVQIRRDRRNEMAFIPAVRTARATIEYALFGHQCVNVFHMQNDVDWTEASLQGLTALLTTWWTTTLAIHQSSDVNYVRSTARDVSTAEGLIIINGDGSGTNGTQAFASLPGNVAACISWRTGLSGRTRRGRSYIAGLPINARTGDSLTEGNIGALVDAGEALIADCLDGGYPLVVASYQLNNAPRTTALLTPVTNVIVDARLDTQRRRLDPTPA